MAEINRNPLDIGYIVYKIGTSEAFAKARNESESLEMSDRDRFRTSIRMAATALKSEKASGYLTPEGHSMNITSKLATFREDVATLDELQASGASFLEKKHYLLRVAEFNHSIKELVDSNSSLRFDDVVLFLRNMDQKINGSDGAAGFENIATDRLNGMRHEIAVEQMLGYLPGVEYAEASVEEDLDGTDLYISIDGSPMTAIDIKAGESNTRFAKKKALRNGWDVNQIVWSHISDEDFNGGFRISKEIAQAKAPFLFKKLQNAVDSNISRRKRSA